MRESDSDPRILLVSDERFNDHETGSDHPESRQRLEAVLARLSHSYLAENLRRISPRPARLDELIQVHDENYLMRFEEAALSGRSYLGHPDNQMGYDSYRIALLAAGAGLAAIDALERGEAGSAMALIRPPGHHAERTAPLGFCFINNAAVAARYWQHRHRRRRIMIIDFDAHHGNGIQAAFEEDPEVFYLSIHEHPTWNFPGTGWGEERGSGPGRGTTLNLPLPPGSGDRQVLNLLNDRVAKAVKKFAPQAMIIAAGFDGHRDDDMSGLAYSSKLFYQLGREIAAWAAPHCPGRLLSLLEGGYQPPLLARCLESYLLGHKLDSH